jgi:hypothetical protein|tara:strand:- start:2120 stop:2377 length:258 start_codon:yes stop_codon:yes gene_type:complete
MIKQTRNSVRFNKLLQDIHNLKVKLLETSYWDDINKIDEKAKQLFELYNNSKSIKQVVNDKIEGMKKQNSYLKYKSFIETKQEKQ